MIIHLINNIQINSSFILKLYIEKYYSYYLHKYNLLKQLKNSFKF